MASQTKETPLFIQQFVEVNDKENITATHY